MEYVVSYFNTCLSFIFDGIYLSKIICAKANSVDLGIDTYPALGESSIYASNLISIDLDLSKDSHFENLDE